MVGAIVREQDERSDLWGENRFWGRGRAYAKAPRGDWEDMKG